MSAGPLLRLQWPLAAVAAIGLHGGLGAVTLVSFADPVLDDRPLGSIVLDLSPVATSAASPAQDLPVGPESTDSAANKAQSESKPQEVTEQQQPIAEPSPTEPEIAVPKATAEAKPDPEPRPEEQKPETRSEASAVETPASQAMAPPKLDAPVAQKSAAPEVGLSPAAARAKLTWHQAIALHLDRFKRYPAGAPAELSRGEVVLQLVVERTGRVVSSHVVRSSGFPILDAAAMAMLERAAPLPRPTVDVPGETFVLTAPIVFRRGK